jgi:hypothetical protein
LEVALIYTLLNCVFERKVSQDALSHSIIFFLKSDFEGSALLQVFLGEDGAALVRHLARDLLMIWFLRF